MTRVNPLMKKKHRTFLSSGEAPTGSTTKGKQGTELVCSNILADLRALSSVDWSSTYFGNVESHSFPVLGFSIASQRGSPKYRLSGASRVLRNHQTMGGMRNHRTELSSDILTISGSPKQFKSFLLVLLLGLVMSLSLTAQP